MIAVGMFSGAGVNILAGATLGGGTRVNWQASFKTPPHVRREWAEQHGLPDIASEKYDRALSAVCTRLGVTTGPAISPDWQAQWNYLR